MGLWLYSSGDGKSNAKADQKLAARLPEQGARLTFIPAASDDADYYYEEFVDRFSRMGFDDFTMLAVDRPLGAGAMVRALRSDLIYLSGGNTFHLLNALNKSSFGLALKDYAERGGVLAGHSAGAIVMTPNIQTAAYPDHDRDENHVGLEDLKALSLVPFELFPHYRANRMGHSSELKHQSTKMGHPIYALKDGSCITVERGSLTFHGPAWCFVKGIRFKVS